MEFFLTSVLAIVLTALGVSAHELSHAFAMWRLRVPIKRISLLGIPVPYVPSFKKRVWIERTQQETTIEIHPLIIAAFVMPEGDAVEALNPRDQALIYGAGPCGSFLYAVVMFLITLIGICVITQVRAWDDPFRVPMLYFETTDGYAILIGIALLASVRFWWRPFCRYGVVLIGMWYLWQVVGSLLIRPDSLGGPVGVFQMGGVLLTRHFDSGIGVWSAPLIAGIFSLLWGLMNTLPIYPLDGGQAVASYLSAFNRKSGVVFQGVTAIVIVALFGLAIYGDIGRMLPHP